MASVVAARKRDGLHSMARRTSQVSTFNLRRDRESRRQPAHQPVPEQPTASCQDSYRIQDLHDQVAAALEVTR